MNTFSYVGENPVNHLDFFGLAKDGLPLNIENCEALNKLIDYEKDHGKWNTMNKYNPINFSRDMVGLDASYPTVGGYVSADWMMRSGGPLGATSLPYASFFAYASVKAIWNMINLSSPLLNINGQANLNAPAAFSYWYYTDGITLEDLFAPALSECACTRK